MRRLVLPLPPSLNHSHINVRNGKRLMRIRSDATKQFYNDAGWLAKQWMREAKWSVPNEDSKVVVKVWVYWPDKRKRDADNTLKLTLDGLKGILFEDDRQTLPRVMDFSVDKSNPRLEVELEVVS